MHEYTTNLFLGIISFNSNNDNGLAFSTQTTFAVTLTADGKLIDLDTAGLLFAILADVTLMELLESSPCRPIVSRAKEFFKVYCINTAFSGGKPPQGFESLSDRLFGTFHKRSIS